MTHQFTYSNGLVQQKQLIRHSDYLKLEELPETTVEEIDAKEAALKLLTGGNEWFTDRSPLFDAIKTGVLNCNGQYYCKVVDFKKEGIYALQRIDCNCNDCVHLLRLLDKQNNIIAADKISQEEIFYFVKEKKEKDIQEGIDSLVKHKGVIKDSERKINKLKNRLLLSQKEKWGYQGQKSPVQYGICDKFKKEVTFIPNTCQLETQKCFVHRKDIGQQLHTAYPSA